MSELEQIDAKIKSVINQITYYQTMADDLRKEKRELLSKQFIEKHEPTLEEVEMSSGEGKPYFGHVWAFTHWMKENNISKSFCEWNKFVYLTSEMLQGQKSQTEFTTIKDIERFQDHE
jgi:FtsZ-binding cell division protein ZapB